MTGISFSRWNVALLLMLAVVVSAPAQPPLVDIYSGKYLNAWVERLAGRVAPVDSDPEPQLDRKVLEAISLAWADSTGGGTRLLRTPEKLAWPVALKEATTHQDRERWVELVQRATKEARKGGVSKEALRDLTATHKRLNENLDGRSDEVTISQFIEGRRFLHLRKLDVALLKEPRVGELLTLADDVASKRRTAPELARLFREKKLRFGPCMPGEEASYLALEKALAAFAKRVKVAAPPR